jgi:hypothetical protein
MNAEVKSIATSTNTSCQSLSDILSSKAESWQTDPSFKVFDTLGSLLSENPQLFDSSQRTMIESVRASHDFEVSTADSDKVLAEESGDNPQRLQPNKDNRAREQRIEAMGKGGTERAKLDEMLKAAPNDRQTHMKIIADYYLSTIEEVLDAYGSMQIHLDDLYNEREKEEGADIPIEAIYKALAFFERCKNTEKNREAEAGGRVYSFTEFWQPPCLNDMDRKYWYNYSQKSTIY